MSETIGKLLSIHSLDVRAVTSALQTIVKGISPEIHETVSPRSINYSRKKSPSVRICSIVPHKTYVALVFASGNTLPDHQHMLVPAKGKGKYVKIQRMDQIGNPAIKVLLSAANKQANL